MNLLLEISKFLIQYWVINTCLNTFKFLPYVAKYDQPLDKGHILKDGYRLLGSSTTIIGFPTAVITGLMIGLILSKWYFGILMGISVFLGHALGSFIKRRAGLKDGSFFPIIDHGDSILIAGLILIYVGEVTWLGFAIAFGLNLLIQPLLCYLGYLLNLRSKPL